MRLEGYGSRLAPRAPFELRRLSSERVVLLHHALAGPRQILVAPSLAEEGDDGSTRVALGPGTASPDEVLARIDEVAHRPGWSLATADYAFDWSPRLVAWSTPDDVAWPCELTLVDGGGDEMIYVLGPFSGAPPRPDDLIAPGMSVVARGEESIELAYTHDGQAWRQRRQWVDLPGCRLLVTAQALEASGREIFVLAEALALRPAD
jgi:hypothetical protein